MSIGVRIEERIKALKITQTELARRTGAPQTTINSLIRKPIRSTPYLVRIARALQTTPAYLTGETDDPVGETQPALVDSQERELIDHFGHLAPADRRALLQIARSMAGGAAPSGTVHESGGAAPATVHDRAQDFRGEEGA